MQTEKATMGSCPKCNSSDALATYSDHTWCYSCKTYGSVGHQTETQTKVIPMNAQHKHTFKTADIPDRKISSDTCKKYGVTVCLLYTSPSPRD